MAIREECSQFIAGHCSNAVSLTLCKGRNLDGNGSNYPTAGTLESLLNPSCLDRTGMSLIDLQFDSGHLFDSGGRSLALGIRCESVVEV
jgi:hypothetical protein